MKKHLSSFKISLNLHKWQQKNLYNQIKVIIPQHNMLPRFNLPLLNDIFETLECSQHLGFITYGLLHMVCIVRVKRFILANHVGTTFFITFTADGRAGGGLTEEVGINNDPDFFFFPQLSWVAKGSEEEFATLELLAALAEGFPNPPLCLVVKGLGLLQCCTCCVRYGF